MDSTCILQNKRNSLSYYMKQNTYVLIMAGGIGSRFWPKSRTSFPKQFIDILGVGKSLLQLTAVRFSKNYLQEHIFVLTNAAYAPIVKEQLPEIPEGNILLEPSRNNTAPCIAYAGYKILQQDPNAVIVVVPSDHVILKEDVFLEKIALAVNFAEANDAIVTLGITPTRPDTGYGYIHYATENQNGIHPVLAFMEKPARELAEQYLADGNYLWNAGMFIWKAQTLKDAFVKYAPEIHALFDSGRACYNTAEETKFIAENYPKTPNISIDYAVLEKADNVYTIPADIGWSDLGTWASLHEVAEKDQANNTVSGDRVALRDTGDCIINLPKEKVAVIRGLQNYIVVDDGAALLIYPKDQEQAIKQEVQEITERFSTINTANT